MSYAFQLGVAEIAFAEPRRTLPTFRLSNPPKSRDIVTITYVFDIKYFHPIKYILEFNLYV